MVEVMEAVQIATIEGNSIKANDSPIRLIQQESNNMIHNVSVINRDQEISNLQHNFMDDDLSSIQILGS